TSCNRHNRHRFVRQTPCSRHVDVIVCCFSRGREPTMERPLPLSSHRRRVLIVDPDPIDRETARKSLDLPDLEIREAVGLADALEEARRTTPDVVLVELARGDGSGFALCRSLRENEALSSTPIMIVSRWAREADRILGFECGADDF